MDTEDPITALTACTYSLKAMIDTWHCQLAHITPDSVKKLLDKNMVKGMEVSGPTTHENATCGACLKGKQSHKPIPNESDIENPCILHRTYSDICGPMETTSWNRYRYFITFIDACSHHLVVKLLKTKDKALKLTRTYFEQAEAETGKHANIFHSDGGGEYGLKDFQNYLESKGIHHENKNTYTPQENGVAKQMN